jgi:predicted Zn finger-like uncharacterized protein
MIRFSCPGCSATFNVSDDKAGKTGKCPKCSSQFTIPTLADAAAASGTAEAEAAPPPPATESAGVEITPCPKCGARLTVDPGDVGLDVECPTCQTVYHAEVAAPAPRKAPGSGVKRSLALVADDDEDDRPSRRSSRRAVAEDDDEDDRPSRRVSKRDDDDDIERPRKKKKKKSRPSDVESKRMVAALLAFFLGSFGVHKFYLGYTTAGLIMLFGNICTCFSVVWVVSLIEFFIYITKTDEDFVDIYQIGQKEWF